MKKILFITISIAILISSCKSTNDNTNVEVVDSSFALNDTSKVNKIVIRQNQDSVILSKDPKGNWVYNNNERAFQPVISELLLVSSKLKFRKRVKKEQNSQVITDLLSNGIRYQFYKDNVNHSFYVNKPNKIGPPETIMLKEGTSQAYYVIGEGYLNFVSTFYDKSLNAWRESSTFKLNISTIKTFKLNLDFKNIYNDNKNQKHSFEVSKNKELFDVEFFIPESGKPQKSVGLELKNYFEFVAGINATPYTGIAPYERVSLGNLLINDIDSKNNIELNFFKSNDPEVIIVENGDTKTKISRGILEMLWKINVSK